MTQLRTTFMSVSAVGTAQVSTTDMFVYVPTVSRVRTSSLSVGSPVLAPAISGPTTVDAANPCTLTASAAGATGYTWTQTGGDSLPFITAGGSLTFTAPRNLTTTTVEFSVTATIDGDETDPATITVTLNRWKIWAKPAAEWVPVVPSDVNQIPDPTPEPTEGLPWALDYEALRASDRKALAHYFGPYPRSINNAASLSTDSYTTAFNNPSYSEYRDVGGMYRDRPIYRPPVSGDYIYQDCVWDIQQAHAAGIDGFYCDLLGLSGSNYDRYAKLIQAADDVNSGFKVVPMIDGNGATGAASPAQAADHVRKYYLRGGAGSAVRNGAWQLSDGRFILASFKSEAKPLSWWQHVFTALRDTWGCEIAFVSVFNNWNQASNYADPNWVYASSRWGYGADPAVVNAASNSKPEAASRGEKWMAPVVFQDNRPWVKLFDEALNTECLRASWGKAINQGADLVQMVTWSDFSETPMAPSAHHGWAVLDLSSYFITRWKTGQYPAILRDCLILSHRSQMLNATITGSTTQPMQHWSRGSMSAVRNDAEVLCLLKEPATVTLTIAGQDYTWDAPAGLSARHYPVQPGSISAQAVRSSSAVAGVTSPVAVRTSDISQDRDYYWFSSLRGTTGQFDVLSQYR